MDIINLDKITANIIILTGHKDDIFVVADTVAKTSKYSVFLEPPGSMHFTEYSSHAAVLMDRCKDLVDRDIKPFLHIQNAEFLDAILETDSDFQVVTVRHDEDSNKYRVRVLDRATALDCRRSFGIDLR